ncbi:ferritin, heavy subunit [Plutella xylostella]|uniref:ferritin, heavy subunit n=1 Tax=Plutella xylostella TaxID=51655 RepID=UPI002032255C|nr:ferritin, heavy subunit [Plutella xylostella]
MLLHCSLTILPKPYTFLISKYMFKLKTSHLNNINNPIHIIKCNKCYYKHHYSSEVESVINRQIQAEQQAAQDYLSMAVTFLHPAMSRPGAGGFFMSMYDEELGHMQDFINYQLMRGGTPAITCVKEPPDNKNLTLLSAFEKGLAMEKLVTELLEDVVKVAETANDYECADFVTSVFLKEQFKSINEMAHHVTRLARLKDEHAIYHYDLELCKSHPYTPKIPK